MNNLKNTWGILAPAILLSACGAAPTYSPPEGPPASESCPIGEVWVCRDHYPTRLDRENPSPLLCMCEDLRGIR